MTPLHMNRIATRCAIGAGVASLLVLAGMAVSVLPDSRLMMAVYLTVLVATAAGVCVAAVCRIQWALHRAFSAGVQTGQAQGRAAPEGRRLRALD